ncbi:hypothetical protein ACFY19_29680 [Streptosporangium saharense]|uniref:hypothetical protein n=1 Tax=Streptosporangium saharense TaxID=1706840 RepID=UPI0036CC3D13
MKPIGLILGAAVVLAVPLLGMPTAHADGSFDCWFGQRQQEQDGYALDAWSCSGTGYVDFTVTVRSGAAAGTYHCGRGFPWNGTLGAHSCSMTESGAKRTP